MSIAVRTKVAKKVMILVYAIIAPPGNLWHKSQVTRLHRLKIGAFSRKLSCLLATLQLTSLDSF
ncbi:MAG: hypothetical protein WBA93_01115 [Microcoleaceae cyanobacterium]